MNTTRVLERVLCFGLMGMPPLFGNTIETVGPNINITRLGGSQAESTISVNPTNNNNLFESDTISNIGHYSMDGGLTWSISNLIALPSSIGDVQTAWDQYGNLYLTRFGPGLNVVVARSSDGGITFGDVRTIPGSAGSNQPSIAVGPSGTGSGSAVWVDFTNSSNQLVAAGAPVTGFNSVGAFGAAQVAGIGDFGDISVGPSGQMAVVYQNNGSGVGPDFIRFNLDPDGLGAGGFGPQSIATNTNVGGFRPIPPQPIRTIDAEANLAWDRSGGPHNGRLYMVYVDAANTTTNDTNIMLRFSDDNGATWSAPVRVNDDTTANSQFNPAIAVDQTTGNVAITWYDARNSASNNTVQIFGGVSDDGGLSFGADFQISAGTTSCLVGGSFNCGDYDKMTFDQGRFWRTWADSSNSTGDNPNGTGALDIYTAAVTVTTVVPEPSSWLLLASATGLLAAIHGRSGRRGRRQGARIGVLLNPLRRSDAR